MSNTTNDEQAPYERVLIGNLSDEVRYPVTLKPMDKPTERAPMLSDDEFTDVIGNAGSLSGLLVRDWYENLITSGELRAVRLMCGNGIPNMTPTDTWIDSPWLCDDCGTEWMQRQNDIEVDRPSFCPGCGAQIVKE